MNFLLYGANGYTAQLILRFAKDYNLTPIIAGRNEAKIKALAEQYRLEYRIFDLDNEATIIENIKDFNIVLHCAGPFMFTAKPMMQACIKAKVHYLDITGEITVFERAARMNEQAKAAGVMLLPGTGFDVVPTDCMARFLKEQLPDATHLKLAFGSVGGALSHGTAMTMAEGQGQSGAVRENGKIIPKPTGHKAMTVDFGLKSLFCMTIPWGDVSTAYYTTGIPNIEVYTATNPKTHQKLKYQKWFNWILRLPFVKAQIKKRIAARPAGPSDERREKALSLVWGEVTNAKGETRRARLQGPEGYTLTAKTALLITQKVAEGRVVPGFQTPAGAYGAELIMQVDGVIRENC